MQSFLTQLPTTIYTSFSRLQAMRRHLSHHYALSNQERKQLLTYYYQTQGTDNVPLGSLGAEWLNLSLESLLEERDTLLAQTDTLENL